jgi:hypothetical protein
MVLIPAGPNTVREYLDDTIESVNHHVGVSKCVVAVIDDSRQNRFATLTASFPNVVVINSFGPRQGQDSSTRGMLFLKQARALKHLVQEYRFDILLRLDTDALVIGDAPHEDILRYLRSHPDVGMVGAFRFRGDGSDKTEAMAVKGRQLSREMSVRHALRHPQLVRVLRRLVRRAEANGYSRGDMCTGGALFMAPGAILKMNEYGFFDLDVLRHSNLMDDALLGLLCCAAGYRLSDLPEDHDVLAINWRNLPMSVEALVSRRKKVVHPVKNQDPSIEPTVRAYFRKLRGGTR